MLSTTARTLKCYSLLACASLVLNLIWEHTHLPLYAGYENISRSLSVVLYATVGDVLYVLGIVLLVALFKRRLLWMDEVKINDYFGLAISGFVLALLVEYKALALHRWAYTAAMPLLFGVGLSPLLQMTVLVPVTVYCTSYAYRNSTQIK